MAGAVPGVRLAKQKSCGGDQVPAGLSGNKAWADSHSSACRTGYQAFQASREGSVICDMEACLQKRPCADRILVRQPQPSRIILLLGVRSGPSVGACSVLSTPKALISSPATVGWHSEYQVEI